jgi:DNA repair exonuclease SbcCD nuclease subunit
MKELKLSKPLTKAAAYSDIHFGRKQNSELHNTDCLKFTEFFCEEVKKQPDIDHIVFLGDFFENRNAINIQTMQFAWKSWNLVNELGLPVFFLVGNHDLYLRTLRHTHSVVFAKALKNFIIIDEPAKVDDVLFLPYLFHDEYNELYSEINQAKIIYGHLELKGFVVTGDTNVLEHGPDHTEFNKPKRIFTGHFHKRQMKDNVVYIGNTFPMDFSDANDSDRGMMVYDYATDKMTFTSWPDAPSYINTTLSELLVNSKAILKKNATVSCLADEEITLEESAAIREKFSTKYNLREFGIVEQQTNDLLEDTDMDLSGLELETTDNIVVNLLGRIDNEKSISPDMLIEIYKGLTPQ